MSKDRIWQEVHAWAMPRILWASHCIQCPHYPRPGVGPSRLGRTNSNRKVRVLCVTHYRSSSPSSLLGDLASMAPRRSSRRPSGSELPSRRVQAVAVHVIWQVAHKPYGVTAARSPKFEGTRRARTGRRRPSALSLQGARAHGAPCNTIGISWLLSVLSQHLPSYWSSPRFAAYTAAATSRTKQSMLSGCSTRALLSLSCCMRSPFGPVCSPQPPIPSARPRWCSTTCLHLKRTSTCGRLPGNAECMVERRIC